MEDLELELEPETGIDSAAVAPPKTDEKPVTKPVTPAADELEVEVDESDPLYKKPDWKTDPLKNANDANDKDYGPRVQKRIGKLRASLSEAAKQRDKASRERDEAVNLTRGYMQKIQELERNLATGTASYIERQAETEDALSKLAEQNLRQALSMGDPEAIAKANSDLATARAKAAQLRTAADYRKAQVQQQYPTPQNYAPQQQQYQAPQQQQAPADPVLAAWQEANPWFSTDEEMTSSALEYHDSIAAQGVRIGSPKYYQLIDAHVKQNFPDYFGADTVKPTSPLAPTTRAAGASAGSQANGTNGNKVKLTASQVAQAKRLGLTNQQYAQTLVRLRKEGVNV